jgi:hypothetical protein
MILQSHVNNVSTSIFSHAAFTLYSYVCTYFIARNSHLLDEIKSSSFDILKLFVYVLVFLLIQDRFKVAVSFHDDNGSILGSTDDDTVYVWNIIRDLCLHRLTVNSLFLRTELLILVFSMIYLLLFIDFYRIMMMFSMVVLFTNF